MSEPDQRITCAIHGETPAAFVCVHILRGAGCGFHCDASEEDRWPDACCDVCQAAFDAVGEWNDDNQPEISVVCTGCWETLRARNAYVPSPVTPYVELVHGCCERAKVRQDEAERVWGFGSRARWDYDDETGTLRFHDEADAGVVADAIPVGSFSTKTSTWLWCWANANYTNEQRVAIEPVRMFGEVRDHERLREPHWSCEEIEGWEVTQIAADVLGAQAIYRAPFDHVHVFFLLRNFRDGRAS